MVKVSIGRLEVSPKLFLNASLTGTIKISLTKLSTQRVTKK
jgi:hypothetical protein